MPRRMGELRRLNIEWNELVATARQHGITRLHLPELSRTVRVTPRAHFQIPRVEARARVARLRTEVASFFTPSMEMANTLDTFGVEIEQIMARGVTGNRIATQMRDSGVLAYEEHSDIHRTRDYWKLVRDGSIGTGIEVVSPPLSGDAGFTSVRKTCGVLVANGSRVDVNCGLHVHVGIARHRNINTFKNILRMFMKWDGAIDSFMAPSRRAGGVSSHWAAPVRIVDQVMFDQATTLNQLADSVGQPHTASPRSHYRYKKVNLMAARQSQTIEFRQHQGTVESRKIEMWVRFILRAFAKAETTTAAEIAAQGDSLDNVLTFLGCDEAEKTYFIGRRDYFAAQPQDRRRFG